MGTTGTLPTLQASAETAFDNNGAPTINYSFAMPGASLALSPSFLSALIGDSLTLAIDLDLGANPSSGLSFRSGGVKATLPVTLDLPGIKIDAVVVAAEAQGSGLDFVFGVNFTGGLAGLPISFSVEGLGAKFPMAVGSGVLGIDPGAVQPAMPTGIGIDLTLPVLAAESPRIRIRGFQPGTGRDRSCRGRLSRRRPRLV